MSVKLAVVTLWAEDVAITAHFYRDVIGLRLLPQHGDRPHFDLGGACRPFSKADCFRRSIPSRPVSRSSLLPLMIWMRPSITCAPITSIYRGASKQMLIRVG
jgi:hypothetical protein